MLLQESKAGGLKDRTVIHGTRPQPNHSPSHYRCLESMTRAEKVVANVGACQAEGLTWLRSGRWVLVMHLA